MFNGEIIFYFKSIKKHMWTRGFYIYMNIYILKGTNFRTFLKGNYAIALDSYGIYVLWKNVEHGINMMFWWYIRHS